MNSSSNLPDGVDNNTPNAPWNENLIPINITVILKMQTEVPENYDYKKEIESEVSDELNRLIYLSSFEIDEIIID